MGIGPIALGSSLDLRRLVRVVEAEALDEVRDGFSLLGRVLILAIDELKPQEGLLEVFLLLGTEGVDPVLGGET